MRSDLSQAQGGASAASNYASSHGLHVALLVGGLTLLALTLLALLFWRRRRSTLKR